MSLATKRSMKNTKISIYPKTKLWVKFIGTLVEGPMELEWVASLSYWLGTQVCIVAAFATMILSQLHL